MTLEIIVSQYIAAFVQWGFLMTFLYSIVTSINKKDKALVFLSFVMFSSYSASIFVAIDTITYFEYFAFDIFTLATIVILGRYITKAAAYYYLLIGLMINASLFFGMHYDIFITENYQPWWFWSVYSFGVNVIDLMMICALVINRDFLGLMKLKGFLFGTLKNAKISLRS
ncbi:hypothetical protein [Pseudoalteromonas sp.]|uniref:hypothetical protein n=1 Tax=Pseudoalteromonas sp. TaxID=53249 RepID=UPI00356322A9